MLSKEEIENMKRRLDEELSRTNYQQSDVCMISIFDTRDVLKYIDNLERKLKELGKGQQSLMQSRKKWKNRYYKMKKANKKLELENKDLQKSVDQIYDDYQDIGKMYFDLDEKRQKLIEKLEEDINELETLNDNYTDADILEGIYTTRGQIIKAKEILSILKGENI